MLGARAEAQPDCGVMNLNIFNRPSVALQRSAEIDREKTKLEESKRGEGLRSCGSSTASFARRANVKALPSRRRER